MMYRIISILLFAAISQHCFAQKPRLILPIGITGEADHVEISSNQKYLFTTSGGLLQMWDYQTGSELDSVTLPHYNSNGPKAIHPDKKLIAFEERRTNDVGEILSSNIHLYNFLTKEIVRTFSLGKKQCEVISFSPDAKYIIVIAGNDPYTNDNIVVRYNVDNGVADTVDFKLQGISSISVSADNELGLLTGFYEGKVYLYNFKTKIIDSVAAAGYSKYLLLNKTSILAVHQDSIEIWELTNHLFQKTFYFKTEGRIESVDLSNDGKQLIYTASNRVEKIYSPSGDFMGYKIINSKMEVFDLHTKKITSSFVLPITAIPEIIKWSKDKEAIIAFDDRSLIKFNIVTGEKINDFNGQSSNISSASFVNQNKFLQIRKDNGLSQLNTTGSVKTKEFIYNGYKILGRSEDGRFEILRKIKANCDSSFQDTIMGKNWVLDDRTLELKKLNVYPVCDTSFLKIFDTYAFSFLDSIVIPKDLSSAHFINTLKVAFDDIVWDVKNHRYSKNNRVSNVSSKTHLTGIVPGGIVSTKFSFWNVSTHKNTEIETNMSILKITYDDFKQQIICVGNKIIKQVTDSKKPTPKDALDSMWQALDNNADVFSDMSSFIIKVYNIKSGKFIYERSDSGFYFSNFTFSDDKKLIAFSKLDESTDRKTFLNVIDVDKNKLYEITEPVGNSSESLALSVEFSNDNRFLICTGSNKQIAFYDFQKRELKFSLYLLNSSDWIIQNKDGLFDATPGAMKSMYFVVTDATDKDEPWKIIDFNQLKHRYYQPELLPILLGFKNEKLREVPAFNRIALAPEVGLSVQKDKLTIQLKNQKGGIGKVSIYIDNTEIIEDARQTSDDSTKQILQITVDMNRYSKFINPSSINIIKVVAYNSQGWLSSRPDTIHFIPAGISAKGAHEVEANDSRKTVKDIRLYGVVAGISDYAGNNIDLKYASKDAQDFAHALAISSANLFDKSNTTVSLLNSEANSDSMLPTKKNIQRVLQWVSTVARPQDVLVIYLSGHGVNFGGQDGDFYYLTSIASDADAEYFKDPDVRNSVAISSAELTIVLNKISARKKILILDACASGKAAENMMVAMRDVPASQVRALDRLADRTGFYILSGSAADAVSYESTMYGQGLLTYSLLKAIRGAALRQDGNEEYVDIQRLLQYAVDEVPLLAKGIGGIQQPLYRSPGDQKSYDIGKVDTKTKKEIILAEPKPVFVATTFINIDENEDDIKLTQLVNAQLREITSKGKDADILFTDAKDYPDAWKMSGKYKINGNSITLSYRLRKNDQKIDKVIKGNKSDLQNFINLVMREVRLTIAK